RPGRGAGADRERDGASSDPRRDHGGEPARHAAKLEPRRRGHLPAGLGGGGGVLGPHLFHDQPEPVGARKGGWAGRGPTGGAGGGGGLGAIGAGGTRRDSA